MLDLFTVLPIALHSVSVYCVSVFVLCCRRPLSSSALSSWCWLFLLVFVCLFSLISCIGLFLFILLLVTLFWGYFCCFFRIRIYCVRMYTLFCVRNSIIEIPHDFLIRIPAATAHCTYFFSLSLSLTLSFWLSLIKNGDENSFTCLIRLFLFILLPVYFNFFALPLWCVLVACVYNA